MSVILDNPYRVVGVLISSSIREQTKQINRLKQFIDADRQIIDDFSFPVLGKLERTQIDLDNAVAKLSLDNDKMTAALFWFYSSNDVTDEPAFNFLKASDTRGALAIWSKLTTSGLVSDRNHSAFQNLSSLLIFEFLKNPESNFVYLERAFKLKIKYLESDFISNLINAATDQTYKITRKVLQQLYFDQIVNSLTSTKILSEVQLIRAISLLEFSGKISFLAKYSDKYTRRINVLLESSTEKRKIDKSLSLKIGKNIANQVSEDLSVLELIYGKDNAKYHLVSDQVSEGILQSSIDYFNFYRDSENDPGSSARDLLKIAYKLACGTIIVQRCQENLTFILNWVNEKPERDRMKKAEPAAIRLRSLLDSSGTKRQTVENAKKLLSESSSPLAQLRIALGPTDEMYLSVCTRIAADAQSMCISEINEFFEKNKSAGFSGNSNFDFRLNDPYLLKIRYAALIEEAWLLILVMDNMDLSDEFKIKFKKNRASLSNIRTQTTPVRPTATSQPVRSVTSTQTQTSSSPRSGCYIATMAYGDYNHPQVIVLRNFRDNYLAKSLAGRQFIAVYYRFSPMLVERLKYRTFINVLIKNILDLTIKTFRKR